MSRCSRGGLTLKTGKIGKVNCLRQNLMMPGERFNIDLSGKVRLESLRERDVMRINAHLGVFMTPLRWVWPEFPDYLKEGPNTLKTPPLLSDVDWSKIGVGSWGGNENHLAAFQDAYLRIYNEWYKWPEDADATTIDTDGMTAVPLSKAWSRCRYNSEPLQASEYEAAAATTVDIRKIAEVQARYRSAMKRDVLSYNRWMELIEDMYKGDGSREVDQVPIMLDQVEVGVNPREIPATDGASLGQWQSLYDFGVDHQIRGVTAPEHCIISYMLTIRFASVTESCHPLATSNNNWWEYVADPEYLGSAVPVPVNANNLYQTTSTTQFGYLPAGWQWRTDHDVIGERIDQRDSFPMMEIPNTQAECKDATRTKPAFRSQALGDYLADIFIKEESNQPIGTSMDSYMAGMVDEETPSDRNKNDEFPHGGKML